MKPARRTRRSYGRAAANLLHLERGYDQLAPNWGGLPSRVMASLGLLTTVTGPTPSMGAAPPGNPVALQAIRFGHTLPAGHGTSSIHQLPTSHLGGLQSLAQPDLLGEPA